MGNKSTKGEAGGPESLLANYTLGDVLGQGAFGVVYECAPKGSTDFHFAVKMVDKVETPMEEIRREAKMMKELEHPAIVKFHAVYFEKCFVCIVMDKYTGGDLIGGMQLHWEKKGQIPPGKIVHVVRAMLAAINHLHVKLYVHCDVKGDNFLLSIKDVTNPECKVFLSDFGTVVKLENENSRLKTACGTKLYWPPEFYAANYSMKADVFACGVICYGLCCGRFPFRNERDTKEKAPKLQASIPAKCQELVFGMLQKKEDKRFTAAQCLQHEWLIDKSPEALRAVETKDELDPAELMREGGANGGQDERRKALLERMQDATRGDGGGLTTTLEVLMRPQFLVEDKKDGRKAEFQWYDKKKMSKTKILELGSKMQNAEIDDRKVDIDTVAKTLKSFDVDPDLFGKGTAKTLEAFTDEVESGSALLMLNASHHKMLVRVVDVVAVRISTGSGPSKKYLVEFSETLPDGRVRENLFRLPGHKKEPVFNAKATVDQIVKDTFGTAEVAFNYAQREVFEEEHKESISYPGVTTIYRKQIIPGQMTRRDLSSTVGEGDVTSKSAASGTTKLYKWMSQSECEKNDVRLRAPKQANDVSALIEAPSGMSEEDLTSMLKEAKADLTKFGKDGAKTLRQFADELLKGEATLKNNEGRVERIVDIVLLKLTKETSGEILVETGEILKNGTKNLLQRLPAIKRRPDENEFVAAQKLLKTKLKIDDVYVTFNASNVELYEERKESHAYPGISTVYRKRVISGVVHTKNPGQGAPPACFACFSGLAKK